MFGKNFRYDGGRQERRSQRLNIASEKIRRSIDEACEQERQSWISDGADERTVQEKVDEMKISLQAKFMKEFQTDMAAKTKEYQRSGGKRSSSSK